MEEVRTSHAECHIANLRSMVKALDGEAVHMFDPQNVMHQNSLQVINAERQIFSRTRDFSLARCIIEADPTARTGPRLTISEPGKWR
jgi:hypothetical protein